MSSVEHGHRAVDYSTDPFSTDPFGRRVALRLRLDRGRLSRAATSSNRASPFFLSTYPLAPSAIAHARSSARPCRVYARTLWRFVAGVSRMVCNRQRSAPLARYSSVTMRLMGGPSTTDSALDAVAVEMT